MSKKLFIFLIILTLNQNALYSWSTPQTISPAGFNFLPALGVSQSNRALVVWEHGETGNFSIQGSYYNGTVWGDVETIASNLILTKPLVGMDDSGNAIVVWQQFDGTNSSIQTAAYLLESGWEIPSTISTGTKNIQPSLSVNGLGQVVVAWIDGSVDVIKVATSTISSGSWTTSSISQSGVVSDSPKVGIDADGDIVVIWHEDFTHKIFASSYDGSWTTPLEISTGDDNFMPELSVSELGHAIAIWKKVSDFSVNASTYSEGDWSAPQTVSADPTFLTGCMAYLVDGFVVWTNLEDEQIYGSNYYSGGWTPEVAISTVAHNDYPSITVSPTGVAIITWTNFNSLEIMSAQFPNGGSPVAPEQVTNSGMNFKSQVSSKGLLNVVAWLHISDTNILVQVSLMDVAHP